MSNIKLQTYENWMLEGVIHLFCQEYGEDYDEFKQKFQRFYELEFQREKCIRIVATDAEKVIGFQSFFYWPMSFEERTIKAYQSGNSLVSSEYRGQGIFHKLLNYVYENQVRFNYDILIGFPVEASFKSFIRNGWDHIFDLSWIYTVINPIGFLFPIKIKNVKPKIGAPLLFKKKIQVSNDSAFMAWRREYQNEDIIWEEIKTKDCTVSFQLKFTSRNKWINEGIIGSIHSENNSPKVLALALKKLRWRVLMKYPSCSIMKFAYNPNINEFEEMRKALKGIYLLSKRKIHFIAKSGQQKIEPSPSMWNLFRGDIDTW